MKTDIAPLRDEYFAELREVLDAVALGFAVEGTHRHAFRVDGRYFDSFSMALLRP